MEPVIEASTAEVLAAAHDEGPREVRGTERVLRGDPEDVDAAVDPAAVAVAPVPRERAVAGLQLDGGQPPHEHAGLRPDRGDHPRVVLEPETSDDSLARPWPHLGHRGRDAQEAERVVEPERALDGRGAPLVVHRGDDPAPAAERLRGGRLGGRRPRPGGDAGGAPTDPAVTPLPPPPDPRRR